MTRDVNLTSQAWCDLVFEGKNKNYGAYALRQKSSDRHLKAMFIVSMLIVTLITGIKLSATIKEAVGDKDTMNREVVLDRINLTEPKPEEIIVPQETTPPPKVLPAIKYTAPVIDKTATIDDEMKTQDELNKSKAVIFSKDLAGDENDPSAVNPKDVKDQVETVTAVKEAVSKPIEVAEIMPSFPGGDKELMKYLSENLKYPVVDLEQGREGRVVLRFVVGTDGNISNIEIQRSISSTCDKEAVRVVKSMPKWIPGRQNGKAVPVYFSLPVRFKIEK